MRDRDAGALVRWQGGFHRVADPLRHPLDGVLSLTNPIGSPPDKVKIGVFRTAQLLSSPASLLAADETTTMQRLQVSPIGLECVCMLSPGSQQQRTCVQHIAACWIAAVLLLEAWFFILQQS